MAKRWGPAVVVGAAILILWAGVWLIGWAMGYQGEPKTFFGGQGMPLAKNADR